MSQKKVYFIGAGPGDPELLTIKGYRLIQQADLVLYAGSLVPKELVDYAKSDARTVDSAPLTLEETHALIVEAVEAEGLVARVHTGDPSLYGAIREQMALLDRDGISYGVIPGVTAGFAAAAAACRSYTVPELTQTVIFSRLEGRTPVPEREKLRHLAAHGTALCLYLSAGDPERLQSELEAAEVSPDTLVIMAYRIGWAEEQIVETRLKQLAKDARKYNFTRQTVFMVLPGQGVADATTTKSLLYDAAFKHGFRS